MKMPELGPRVVKALSAICKNLGQGNGMLWAVDVE